MQTSHSQVSSPVRKVNRRSNSHVTGLFASEKMKAMIPWESHLEYEFLCIAEVDQSISNIYAQPRWIHFRHRGKERAHAPDFFICQNGEAIYIEVKPLARTRAEDFTQRTATVAEILAKEGAKYVVVTEEEIRRQPLMTNVRTLLRGRGTTPDSGTRAALRALVRTTFNGRCTVRQLCSATGLGRITSDVVYSLILRGELETNLHTEKLSPESYVWLPTNDQRPRLARTSLWEARHE